MCLRVCPVVLPAAEGRWAPPRSSNGPSTTPGGTPQPLLSCFPFLLQGDNDPLDALEIGSDDEVTGGIYTVKPICEGCTLQQQVRAYSSSGAQTYRPCWQHMLRQGNAADLGMRGGLHLPGGTRAEGTVHCKQQPGWARPSRWFGLLVPAAGVLALTDAGEMDWKVIN